MVSPLSSRLLGLQSMVNGNGKGQQTHQHSSNQEPNRSPKLPSASSSVLSSAGRALILPDGAALPSPHSKPSKTSSCHNGMSKVPSALTRSLLSRYHPIFPRASGRVSGYSADQENSSISSSSMPTSVLFRNTVTTDNYPSVKDKRARQVHNRERKRKAEEMNFVAANVKKDLENAGRRIKHIVNRKCSALSLVSIDMSNVSLVLSKDYDMQQQDSSRLDQNQICAKDSYNNFYEDAIKLVAGTRPLYSPQKLHRSSSRHISVGDDPGELMTHLVAAADSSGESRSDTPPSSISSYTESDVSAQGGVPTSKALLGSLDDCFTVPPTKALTIVG